MNKYLMLINISEEANITKTQAKLAIESLLENITNTLKTNHRATIKGFGTWYLVHKNTRIRRNPSNGKSITVNETNAIYFKSSITINKKIQNIEDF